jgi:hypothetical protein
LVVGGLVAAAAAWLWVRLLGDAGTPVRVLLIALGLLAAGVGIWVRLASSRPAFVEGFVPEGRSLALLILAGGGGLLALGVTALNLAALAGTPGLPWRPGTLILMEILVAPWGAWLAVAFLRRAGSPGSVTAREETAALLTLAALTAFTASWALYLGADRAQEWDTIRFFLAVVALVPLVAAPLIVVSRGVRRAVVSVLILVHFGGILTAVMSAPPAPWLAGLVWTWFYRPYLEFMYLNNAYHFYAPEPGPASYLWYRIEFEDAEHRPHSKWLKIPDMDDNTGRPRYPVALDYQRMLAMTENTVHGEPRPTKVVGPDGLLHDAAFYVERVKHSPLVGGGPVVIGVQRPETGLILPFHPDVSLDKQYQAPNAVSRRLLESFARNVMQKAAAENPGLTPVKAKAYRVVHIIVQPQVLAAGWDPCYPTFYVPYYMGEFYADGKMTKAGQEDPFLYWLVPILKDYPNQDDSNIQAYVFRHAGEPPGQCTLDGSEKRLKTRLKLPPDR